MSSEAGYVWAEDAVYLVHSVQVVLIKDPLRKLFCYENTSHTELFIADSISERRNRYHASK